MIVHPDQCSETRLAIVTDRAFVFDEFEPVALQESDQLAELRAEPGPPCALPSACREPASRPAGTRAASPGFQPWVCFGPFLLSSLRQARLDPQHQRFIQESWIGGGSGFPEGFGAGSGLARGGEVSADAEGVAAVEAGVALEA